MPKRDRRRTILVWAGYILLLTCVVMPLPIYKDYLVHDYKLYREARAFNQLEHPAGSSRIAFQKYLGLYVGNSNHCDYFVGELRQYTGDSQANESFYADKVVDGLGVSVAIARNGDLLGELRQSDMPFQFDNLPVWSTSFAPARDHLYLVYIFDINFDSGWDIRCS